MVNEYKYAGDRIYGPNPVRLVSLSLSPAPAAVVAVAALAGAINSRSIADGEFVLAAARAITGVTVGLFLPASLPALLSATPPALLSAFLPALEPPSSTAAPGVAALVDAAWRNRINTDFSTFSV